MSTPCWKLGTVALLAAGLAACASGPARVKGAPPPPAQAAPSETDAAFDLLMRGDETNARKKIKAILKRDPMNATAQLLSDSITRDPKELLGPDSYPYVVQAGDTTVTLAEHFLGNRLKAYQLLRYNALKAPATLIAGQTLRIPGEPARVGPVRRPEPAPMRPAPVTPKPAPAKSSAASKPFANPAAARQARAAGLAALNQGNVERAIGLLHRAATLDPGNPLIARDLTRAERIAATVKARK